MQQWLIQVWQDTGRTILFVTHDVDEAIFLSDRIVVMSARPGRISQIIPVSIDRPRSLDSLTTPDFMAIKRTILGLLYHGPSAQDPAQKPAQEHPAPAVPR